MDKTICVLGVTTRDPKLQGVELDESSVILGDIGICARREILLKLYFGLPKNS